MRLAVLLGLALAGCSTGGSDTSARADCERQANDDPKVVEVYQRSNGNYTYAGTQARDELLVAQREAFQRCMRGKGLLPPGGVQPVQPRL